MPLPRIVEVQGPPPLWTVMMQHEFGASERVSRKLWHELCRTGAAHLLPFSRLLELRCALGVSLFVCEDFPPRALIQGLETLVARGALRRDEVVDTEERLLQMSDANGNWG